MSIIKVYELEGNPFPRWVRRFGLLALALALPFPTAAQPPPAEDLTELSLEELLQLQVTSVAKRDQPWRESAAAIHVITAEDLRRSGATSIPQALRQVPGLQVAQIDASKWAVSARGFDGQFANKLLVLIDGRSIYTPLFAGVFWELQDTPLEDVERIEVIRGPGAALWGANAVNGVINVVTKDAADTQGGLLALGSGNEERGFATFRYGGKLGEQTHYRIFGKGFDRDGTAASGLLPGGPSGGGRGADANDDWDGLRGGFRIDRKAGADRLTVSGEIFDHTLGRAGTGVSFEPPFRRPLSEPVDGAGGHLLARWSHVTQAGSDWALQLYFDRSEYISEIFDDRRDTVDLDWQHRFAIGRRHDFVWGLGFRSSSDREGSRFSTFDPESEDHQVLSAFVQDELTTAGERLRFILGTKLEHNDYTGTEVQPNLRLLWTPGPKSALWASVARAVRTPARAETGARLIANVLRQPTGTVAFVTAFGDPEVASEELLACELGYRFQPTSNLFVDLAAFRNDYQNVIALTPGMPFFEPPPPFPHVVAPLQVTNAAEGETHGLEASVVWAGGRGWRLFGGYTFLDMELTAPPGVVLVSEPGDVPRHQVLLRSSLDFAHRGEWDVLVQYVDELTRPGIAGYYRVDTRLGWRPWDAVELSLVVENALDERHSEFSSTIAGTTVLTEIERSVHGKVTWRF